MDRKEYLSKLIVSCPMENLCSSCSIDKFRKASLVDLIKLLNNMLDEEVLLVTQQHVKCLKSRQKDIEANSILIPQTVMTL
ncbi:MAG: hypothetical protein HQ522_19915 [Bacteroidetes bacterium]|nr:hypothetical protein [Bacteroidota bacterium]